MIKFVFRELRIFFSLSLLLTIVSLPFSYAQDLESSYDMLPKMKSYLNQPETMLDQNLEGLSIPQVTDDQQTMEEKNQELPEEKALTRSVEATKNIYFDKKINPKEYILGPTDIIGVYLWGELDKEFRISVTPEGVLIIPTVGPVEVADLTLEKAKDLVKQAVARKYKGIDVSVYLVEPRWFNVYISGVVNSPGTKLSNSLSRASDVYNMAKPTKRGSTLSVAGKRGSSSRNVTILRDGKSIPVDLLRFLKLGELGANPYIMNGDVIKVPEYGGDISVFGEVNSFGIYEFKNGDRLKDLVIYGGGLTTLADSTNADLIRFKEDGYNLDYMKIDLRDALVSNPNDPKYRLFEGDRLIVSTRADYKRYAAVFVSGAVKYSGQYAIVTHMTKLSDAIDMAGGLTPYADLTDARIIRPLTSATRDMEYDRLRKMPVAEMTDNEYEYFKQRARTTQGLINVDFIKLIQNGDKSADMILEPGDNIYIPMKRNMVEVIGAVKYPGNIAMESGKDYTYYVTKAGSFSWNADQGGVQIVKGKTGQRFEPKKKRDLEPGDTIFVPEKKPKDYWVLFRETTLIFANVATAVIVAKNILK